MKKFVAPIVLFIIAAGLGAYLMLDFSGVKSSFDDEAYLQARGKIDSLQIALFEAQGNPDLQLSIREELDRSWEDLSELRENGGTVEQAPVSNPWGLSNEVLAWIAGGVAAVIVCVILLLAISHRKKVLTQKMESLKSEQRFREPKDGIESEVTLAPRPRPQKRSIIDEVSQYAAANAMPSNPSAPSPTKMAFEDENGVPENKILTTDLDAVRPQLRPTAKERITSAMQSLSDVLRSPRGLSRDRTMKLRAQSHNVTGGPALQPNPMKTNKFDREFTDKAKIMQMSRRGFPASAIATQLKIPQNQVEAIIKESIESGN